MKILALLLAIYTPVMVLIHVSTGKILMAWNEQPDSLIGRWFPPRRALRTEGVYWLLALAAWTLWRPEALKVLVAAFSIIHFAIWFAAEFRAGGRGESAFAASSGTKRAIVAFDLAEACVMTVLTVVAVRSLG